MKLLSTELRMLQAYKIDISGLHEDYKTEFFRDMSFIEKQVNSAPSDDAESRESNSECLKIDPGDVNQRWRKTEDGWEREDDPSAEEPALDRDTKPTAPEWAKKLYKKIALVSHPDRTLQDHRRDKLNKIFTDSAQAMGEGDFKRLLGYALDLDIDIEDNETAVPLLTERIADLKQEIAEIERSLSWLWGESLGALDVRVKIAQSYLSSKQITLNKNDIMSIIQEIEESNDTGPDSKS